MEEQASVLSLLSVELEFLKSLWIGNHQGLAGHWGCQSSLHSLSRAVWRAREAQRVSPGYRDGVGSLPKSHHAQLQWWMELSRAHYCPGSWSSVPCLVGVFGQGNKQIFFIYESVLSFIDSSTRHHALSPQLGLKPGIFDSTLCISLQHSGHCCISSLELH